MDSLCVSFEHLYKYTDANRNLYAGKHIDVYKDGDPDLYKNNYRNLYAGKHINVYKDGDVYLYKNNYRHVYTC
jgi:hypothetical protein